MALKVGTATCFRLQGLLSILFLLTILTNHQYCAESYSNYINIDDDVEDTTSSSSSSTDRSILLSTTTSSSVADTTPLLSHSSIKIPSTSQRLPPSLLSLQQLPHHHHTQPSSEEEEEEEDEIDSKVIIAGAGVVGGRGRTTESTITSSSLTSSTTTLITTSTTTTTEANETPYQFIFAHPIYNVTIPENSVQKTYAIQPYSDKDRMGIQLLFDVDRPSHQIVDVKYQIVGGDKNKIFKAEERIIGDFAFLTIRTRTNNIVLNREKGDSYRLRVRATITRSSKIGTKRRSIQEVDALVDVKVLDKNDLSPLFYPTKYSITIADDTPLHQSILRVTAEDADVGINGGKRENVLDIISRK